MNKHFLTIVLTLCTILFVYAQPKIKTPQSKQNKKITKSIKKVPQNASCKSQKPILDLDFIKMNIGKI
ncbi:MAG: hypothetical protein QM539_04840 [Alphaproteobacteria bacterium]|nr:hypothetical protein [Alphaproteobacteria bacterium]